MAQGLPRNFLGGVLAAEQMQAEKSAAKLQQVMGLASLLERQEAGQRAAQLAPLQMQLMQAKVAEAQADTQQRAELDKILSGLPEEQRALARLAPQQFVQGLFKAAPQPRVVSPGGALVNDSGKEIYRNPTADKDARTSFEKLLDAAGISDPQRRSQLIGQYINKQSTHQAPVNVYSSTLVPGVDKAGNPVFGQPSPREGVPPRIVPDFFPAPRPSSKSDNSFAVIAGEYQAADELIEKLIQGVQSGGKLGAVGIPGVASQVYETAVGAVNPNAPTPAIDVRSNKEALLDKMKALATRKDSNLSNKDIERYERILGMDDKLTTPGAVVRALNNVRGDLRRRRINLSPPAPGAARPAQTEQFKEGEVYMDGKGNRAVYLGNGKWKDAP